MRLTPATFLLLCLAASPAAAAPPEVVAVPPPDPSKWAEIPAKPGRMLHLKAPGKADWVLVDDSAADLCACGDGSEAKFCSPAPGRYKVLVTAEKGKPSRVVVVVGDGRPEPAPPAPEPKPVDPLRGKLKAAFDADKGDPADAHQLASLYRQAAKLAADRSVPSTKELLRRVRTAGEGLFEAGELKTLRAAAAEELRAALGASSDDPIADAQREAAASSFTKLADILAGY